MERKYQKRVDRRYIETCDKVETLNDEEYTTLWYVCDNWLSHGFYWSIVQFFIPIGNKLFSFSFSITFFFFFFFFFFFPSTNRIDVRDKCSPLTSITTPVILQICFIVESKHISLNATYIKSVDIVDSRDFF